MYPLSVEQLLVMCESFFSGRAGLDVYKEMLREAGDIPPRAALELANLCFAHEPKMFLLNARFEIGEGRLVTARIAGDADPLDEATLIIEEYCLFGLHEGAVAFCPFSVNDHVAMQPSWRAIAAALPACETDPKAVKAALETFMGLRTLAALTVGRTRGGMRLTHFHRHPALSAEMAAAYLRQCIATTMPAAQC